MQIPESRFEPHRARAPRRVLLLIIVTMAAGVLVAGGFLLWRARTPILAINQTERPQTAIELWNAARYDEVIDVATEQLAQYPLDATALALRGFSRFYLAVQAVESERRHTLLVGSVQDLRRILLVEDPDLEDQIHYVLGKAYFHRGRYFYDAAIDQLEAARQEGLIQLDLLEYLALASRDIGRVDEAERYFREAIETGDEAIHKVSLAGMLVEQERFLDADRLLDDAIAQTEDVTLLQDALILLGESLRNQARHEEAIGVYRRLLEVNESSAEAHFGIGEVYLAEGEQDQARFEWREAIRLDPNHIESLQRLQEY